MANDTFDKLLTSTPLNSTAGRVTSKGGEAWTPRKPVPQGHMHWDSPPPMYQFDTQNAHETTPNLVGTKFGRFTVVGVLGDGSKTNRGLRWVVRCVCGDYEARSTSAIKLAAVVQDHEKQTGYQCWNCTQLKSIQGVYKKKGSKPLSHFTSQNGQRAPEQRKTPTDVIASVIGGDTAAADQIIARLNSAGYRVVRDGAPTANRAAGGDA